MRKLWHGLFNHPIEFSPPQIRRQFSINYEVDVNTLFQIWACSCGIRGYSWFFISDDNQILAWGQYTFGDGVTGSNT